MKRFIVYALAADVCSLLNVELKPLNLELLMLTLENIDLRKNAEARVYVKCETVSVAFAKEAGLVISLEGPNHYQVGDAIISGSTGSRWSVTRDRFETKYQACSGLEMGADGRYEAKPVPVLALQMQEAFTAQRCVGGDWLRGVKGDWLLQYQPGDYGVVEQQRFAQVYVAQPVNPSIPTLYSN